MKHVKSYVRHSVDFLNRLPKEKNEKEVLITLDVTDMYTNIDHNLAKEAIEYWLTTHPECLPRNISKEFVLEPLSIVLEFNTFTYNGRFYLQIRGISMGTKSAPTIATLVMAYLEIKAISSHRDQVRQTCTRRVYLQMAKIFGRLFDQLGHQNRHSS